MISIGRLIDILELTDETDVAQLERQRDAALAFIETQTRRYFGPIESFTEWIRGTGTRSLFLRDIPQVGGAYTTAVLEYSYPGATGEAITSGASDGFALRIHGTEAELVRAGSGGVWTRGYDYQADYSRGYTEDTGPDDIEDLLIELIRLKVNAGGEEVMKSESYGGYSFTRFDEVSLSDDASQTIQSWRRLVFA